MKFLDSLDKIMTKMEEYICTIALMASMIILFLNIVLRYVFSQGWPWAEEVVRYLIAVVTFVGLSAGVNEGQTIRMDIVLQLSKESTRRKLEIFVNILSCVFSIVLTVISFNFAMQTKNYGQVTSALQMPFYLLYMIIVVGSFFTAICYLQQALNHIKGPVNVNQNEEVLE